MARGDKSKYTGKQKREARHIEESYESRGVGRGEAERRAWATVNRQDGGGKAGGSGHGSTHADRSRAAKKGWETRRKNGSG